MIGSLTVRTWAVTLGLLGAALLAAFAVVATGGQPLVVGVGLLSLGVVGYLSYRSGGRYAFEYDHARPMGPAELPDVRRAALEVCERAGRPVPRLVVMEMDTPGAVVGYDAGDPVVAVDPLLPRIVGSEGVRALFAHELGHLGTDIHTDALRAHLPQVVGFGAFWLVCLARRGPAVATLGSVVFVALALADDLSDDPRPRRLRYLLGLGVEPLALAASRYANRLEEYRADAFAARVVDSETLAEALYRVAAVATGENVEDVAGPVPWNADRTLRFALFATHPSIENRIAYLGCELPAWTRPYRPHRDALR
ncbi:MAG: M48 family metallopeptidase [Salinigranum sp.]